MNTEQTVARASSPQPPRFGLEARATLTRRRALQLSAGAAAAALTGCRQEERTFNYKPERAPLPEEAMEFFRRYPDFFIFSTPDKVPRDLKWEDGADVPELGDPAAKKGGTYYHYMPDFARTLRFIGPDASGAFRKYILDGNVLRLARQHPDTLRWFPQLASHWAFDPDGRTVFFKLDPRATFSDGVPVRADDYLFCFYFMRCNYTADLWYQQFYTDTYTNITKFDDLTIAITMRDKKPDLLFKAADSVRPVPVHFYLELADDWQDVYQWKFEPTTGAYEVRPENVDKGRRILLTKVQNWWAADLKHMRYRYNVDRMSFVTIRDKNKAFEVFRKGELDIFNMRLSDDWHRKLPHNDPQVTKGYIEKVLFYNQIPRVTWGFSMNCSRPLLKEKLIRQGIQHAMNWDIAIREVFKGDATRMQTSSDGYPEMTYPGIRSRSFDITAAEQLFAKAGFTQRGPDGIFLNDKKERLSFTMTTGYKMFADVLTILKKEAVKAGVEFNLEIIEQTAAWKKADEKKHDLSFSAKNVSVEMYPRFRETWHSSNAYKEDGSIKTDTNNETQTASKELDAMIEAYEKADNMPEIVRLAREMMTWLHDDASFVPAWVQPYYRVAHWRWMRWPKDFNVRTSRDWEEFHLFWIDTEMKEETLRAMKEDSTFPPQVLTFDQWKEKPPA